MGGVGSEHDPTDGSMHPDGLQAGGVTTDQVQGQSRGEHLVAIAEDDPVTVDLNHERSHLFGGEAVAQCLAGHVPPGGEGHLSILHVESSGGKLIEAPHVVVVEVGEDDIAHRCRVDADQGQPLGRAAQEGAAPTLAVLAAETGVNNPGAVLTDDGPHEVVHGHGHIVAVSADEVLGPPGRSLAVLDRVDLVDRVAHPVLSHSLARAENPLLPSRFIRECRRRLVRRCGRCRSPTSGRGSRRCPRPGWARPAT